MKAKISVFLVLALAGVVVGLAQGHEAKALTLSCGSSSAHFEQFPDGTNAIAWKIYRDGVVYRTGTASFVGTAGDVSISFDAIGEFYWKVVYSWTADGGGSRSIEKQMLCTAPCHCSTSTVTTTIPGPTTTLRETTTVSTAPPPPVTVTTTLPAPPPVTVTTTTPAPPARTVTTTRTIKAKPPKARVVYRDRWKTRVVTKTKVVHEKAKCRCANGYRLWHGQCHPIAHGKG